MKSLVAGFGLFQLLAGSAFADHVSCLRAACPTEVEMISVAEDRSYGLLLGAPVSGCGRVRYRIETTGHEFLGMTPVLHPGDVAVVRMGRGFAEGTHRLLVRPEGCKRAPTLARRVMLRKPSPDHGWRASLILAGTSPDRAY